MPGPRQPLKVIEGNGRKHLTKKEKYEREQSEVKVERPKYVLAPDYLPQELRKEFNDISRQLLALDMGFCKLDRDTLAMYLMARQQYLKATEEVAFAIEGHLTKPLGEWSSAQDKFFKQARACAQDLGLTVTARCRLVLPPKDKTEPEDEFERLMSARFG